jgi:hypothetical protein
MVRVYCIDMDTWSIQVDTKLWPFTWYARNDLGFESPDFYAYTEALVWVNSWEKRIHEPLE